LNDNFIKKTPNGDIDGKTLIEKGHLLLNLFSTFPPDGSNV